MSSPKSHASTTPESGSCTRRGRFGRWRWANDDARGLGQHALGGVARDRARRRPGGGGAPDDPCEDRRRHPPLRARAARRGGQGRGQTANIPQLEATAPVLGLIVDEAVVQDRYMNALTDGYGES